MQRNNLSQAEKFLKIALERQRSAVAYYWLGVTYMNDHQPAETESALLKAIELRPNFPQA